MENRDPLGMSLMAHNLNRRRWSDWGLVPGPVDFDEPSFSYDMQDPIAEYRASMVAEVALSIPGVERTYVGCQAGGTGGPDGQATAVLTRPRDDAILMMKSIRPALVGFLVSVDCAPFELLDLWLALRRELPQVWLHSPECRFYKPGSFRTELAAATG